MKLKDPDYLSKLRDSVVRQIQDAGITQAVVFDDQLSEVVTAKHWTQFIGVVERLEDHDLKLAIEQILSDKTGKIEDIPDDETLAKLTEFLEQENATHLTSALKTDSGVGGALEKLVLLLEKLNITVEKFSSLAESIPRDRKLYFLDYRISSNPDDAGKDAAQLLESIVTDLEKDQAVSERFPIAILMSRAEDGHPDEYERSKILEESGYVAANYTYFDKTFLEEETAEINLLVILDGLLKSQSFSSNYFNLIQQFACEASENAKNVARRLYGIGPAEFRAFANPLSELPEDRQVKSEEHFRGLIFQLFAYNLQSNDTLRKTIIALVKLLLEEDGTSAPATVEGHQLHQLHADLLYDRNKSVINSRPEFGDIYIKNKKYYILITPECDLVPRKNEDSDKIAPKAERLLFVEGRTEKKKPDLGEDTVVFPLFRGADKCELEWIVWDLRKPFVIACGSMNKTMKKVARMRMAEAELVQQRFASDILSVGTDDIFESVKRRSAYIWEHNATSKDKNFCKCIGEFSILELHQRKKRGGFSSLWSLPLDQHGVICGPNAVYPLIDPDLIPYLRKYCTKEEFSGKISSQNKKPKVQYFEFENIPHFIISSPGISKNNFKLQVEKKFAKRKKN